VCGVGKVHDRNAALIPGLNFNVASRHRNQRAVVRDTVFTVALRRGHLVVAREAEFIVVQIENCVSSPKRSDRSGGTARRVHRPTHQ
jgi:hypothetical protein